MAQAPRLHFLPAMRRRASIVSLVVLLLVPSLGTSCAHGTVTGPRADLRAEPLLDTIQQRTFAFFWERTNPANGLPPDRWPQKSFSSIAAVGFALSAYPVGVEHGWVTRQQAADRTLTTLRWFYQAP